MDAKLGDRVVIIEAQIIGIIVSHTVWIDGSQRFEVQYWNEGKRETVNCEPRELRCKPN